MPIFMWCVLAGVGVAAVLKAIGAGDLRLPSQVRPALQALLYLGTAALVVFTAYRSLNRPDPRVDFSHLDRRSYWAQFDRESGQMPPGAILICDWPEANEAKYLQAAEGWRPDLKVTIADTLLGGDGLQIDRWLAEGRPLFMLDNPASLLTRYTAARDGPYLERIPQAGREPPRPPWRTR